MEMVPQSGALWFAFGCFLVGLGLGGLVEYWRLSRRRQIEKPTEVEYRWVESGWDPKTGEFYSRLSD